MLRPLIPPSADTPPPQSFEGTGSAGIHGTTERNAPIEGIIGSDRLIARRHVKDIGIAIITVVITTNYDIGSNVSKGT